MTFTKRLHDGIRRGEITCTVRIWTRLQVRVGGRYRMEEGEIEIDSIEQIGFPAITPALARESGIHGSSRSTQSCQAWPGRKDLPDPLSLHSTPTYARSQ